MNHAIGFALILNHPGNFSQEFARKLLALATDCQFRTFGLVLAFALGTVPIVAPAVAAVTFRVADDFGHVRRQRAATGAFAFDCAM